MEQIGVHEAKTQLSKILHRIEMGEEFEITNRGRVVARITAPEETDKRKQGREALERLMALKGTLKGVSFEEAMAWRREGLE
jgi:prevent-host-death family protein